MMLRPKRRWRSAQRASHEECAREHVDVSERNGGPEPPAMPEDCDPVGPHRHRRPHGQVPLVGGRDEDGGGRDEPQRDQETAISEPADAGKSRGELQPQRRCAGDAQVLKFRPDHLLLNCVDEPVACARDTPPRHGGEQPHQRPGSRRRGAPLDEHRHPPGEGSTHEQGNGRECDHVRCRQRSGKRRRTPLQPHAAVQCSPRRSRVRGGANRRRVLLSTRYRVPEPC